MSWATWHDDVVKAIKEEKLSLAARRWLFREAYYEGLEIKEALEIAKNPATKFRQGSGWVRALKR